jgi:hypothetical protein
VHHRPTRRTRRSHLHPLLRRRAFTVEPPQNPLDPKSRARVRTPSLPLPSFTLTRDGSLALAGGASYTQTSYASSAGGTRAGTTYTSHASSSGQWSSNPSAPTFPTYGKSGPYVLHAAYGSLFLATQVYMYVVVNLQMSCRTADAASDNELQSVCKCPVSIRIQQRCSRTR